MKRFISFAALIMLFINLAFATATEEYDIRVLTDSTGCVEITGYNGSDSIVYIPSHIKSGEMEYRVSRIGEKAFYYNSKIEEVIMPASITQIGKMAFTGCYNLKVLVIPESLKKMEPYALTAQRTKTVVIPDNVEKADYALLLNANSLQTLVMGRNVAEIKDAALGGLKSLRELYILSPQIPEIEPESYPFYNSECKNATVYVPASLLSKYKEKSARDSNEEGYSEHGTEKDWSFFHDYKPMPDLFTVLYKDKYLVRAGDYAPVLYETINYAGLEIMDVRWVVDNDKVADIQDGFIYGQTPGETTNARLAVNTSKGEFLSKDITIRVMKPEPEEKPQGEKSPKKGSRMKIGEPQPSERLIYTIDGIYIGNDIETLPAGIYVEKSGERTKKIYCCPIKLFERMKN